MRLIVCALLTLSVAATAARAQTPSPALDDVMASHQGAKMEKFEMQCFDIAISGDWASEWCTEHQIVQLGAGKPPFIGWGKMLIVLHKGRDGTWRIKHEMWNQALAPEATR